MSGGAASLASRLAAVRERIRAAAERSGRATEAIQIVAVSKTFPAEQVLEGLEAGLRVFGENRVQEAAGKIPEVAADPRGRSARWHLVGPLQRNKPRKAAALFDRIESVDRRELASALDRAAGSLGKRLDVLLQVNIDEEPQKAGPPPSEARELLAVIDACIHLRPVGLMAIPRPGHEAEEMRPSFARLRTLARELNQERAEPEQLRELSMGMSADFEVAIEEGSTWIRLGTALFGERVA
ncbi:MAG: YggS family pyridoxal phosphate-dependent enzyme [Myxococcota bacterium]|nr:YggS family pyridoxal phosphate-dependent enzyme [Myxococcota bacterium]